MTTASETDWLSTVALMSCVPFEVPVKVAVAWPLTNWALAFESEPWGVPIRAKIWAGGTGNGGNPMRFAAAVVPPLLRPRISAVNVEFALMKIVVGLALWRSCSHRVTGKLTLAPGAGP